MAHEIETMMYVGNEVPWHKLGKKLDNPANSEEAIEAAGLDWKVEAVPVYSEIREAISGFQAIRRVTDKRVYQIAGTRYVPIQNSEAFKFFDSVAGHNGIQKPAIYNTAGSLRNGARIWILAKLEGELNIKGDKIEKFICMVNSHDGSTPLRMFYTPIRVVCQNTLKMAESQSSNRFYTRHTTNFAARIDVAKQTLELANKFYDGFAEEANFLAEKKMTPIELDVFIDAMFKAKKEKDEFDKQKNDFTRGVIMPMNSYSAKEREKVMVRRLFSEGRGQDNPFIKDTRWAAFNAITEYVDYFDIPRNSKLYKPDDVRLQSAWFGSGSELKEKALDYLLKN